MLTITIKIYLLASLHIGDRKQTMRGDADVIVKNIRIAQILVFFACISVLALPVLNTLIVAPSFTEFLKNVAEKILVKSATKMTNHIDSQEDLTNKTTFSKEFFQQVEKERMLLNLDKVKIFTRAGEIIYSSDTTDIGTYTQKKFFSDLVEHKETKSLLVVEDKDQPDKALFLVETYVPIFKNGRTIGVFEIYYDMTETKQDLAKLESTINWIVLSVSLALLLAVLGSSYLTRRNSLLREKTEAEKDDLIKELSTALGEIKALRGILPLCSFCKKIRDDSGYWEQVDVYIHQHSNADISHSVCPDCAEEQYPDIYQKVLERKTLTPENGPSENP